MKPPFAWDAYSDQPYQLKDRTFKKQLRTAQRTSLLKTALFGLFWLPLGVLSMPFLRQKNVETDHFFGLLVDPLREPDKTRDVIESLGVQELLIRIKMWETESLDAVTDFLRKLEGRSFLFVLMQDRELVENETLRKVSFSRIFAALTPFGARFQIGTTPNRLKWGFASIDEYLDFFKTALRLRDANYPQLKLIGPGVIDFEYPYTAHALFNLKGVRFDALAALLYVDRRGAPENSQAGCDLPCKINLLSSLSMLSPRAKGDLYLTETNWPLTGTAPYAPTSEKECVDEEAHASYLVRYYLLALATQQVRTVYWHQLAAPGYGLVDTRKGWRERPAYHAFKTIIHMLNSARYVALSQKRDRFEMLLEKPDGLLRIFWRNGGSETQHFAQSQQFTDRDGNTFITDTLVISDAPVYLHEKEQ
ncbi:MAG TPA: glycosyl hydrolase, partial [Sulfuricurvum sp.]|nr:glycosyl hydrolase [Sulfuricurvum sp.]